MASQPLFVIGAPRSGTTFLCYALNQHESIHLTNENRIFVLLKDMLEVRCGRAEFLAHEARAQFVRFFVAHAGELVERFYRDGLGVTAPIWGDKHPPYADPSVLSAQRRFDTGWTQSGSCLRLISRALPAAKFIHIHRNSSDVAHSLLNKGWVATIAEGKDVWRQYVTEILEFFAETGKGRQLTLSYADLIEAPAATAAAIGRFLDLSDWSEIAEFLQAQRLHPTPFSDPVTDLAARPRRLVPPPGSIRTQRAPGRDRRRP